MGFVDRGKEAQRAREDGLDRRGGEQQPPARHRSASAPPNGPTNAIGRKPAAATIPVQPAWPVDVVTRMPTAIVSIHVPMLDMNAPVQNIA